MIYNISNISKYLNNLHRSRRQDNRPYIYRNRPYIYRNRPYIYRNRPYIYRNRPNKPMSSKKKTRVDNAVEGERRKDDILSRIIQLEHSLGGLAPGLLDMFCAGFEPEEIEAVQSELEWLYGPRWDRQGPVNLETLQTYEALHVYDQRRPSHSSVI
jgi:hypothetical protein